MRTIPRRNDPELDLREIRAFEVLLRERNLTRAAAVLGVSQPALSKKLASLRRYFGDPLFIRVGHRMEPTAKSLELESSIRSLLDDVTMLRTRHRPFDPRSITRTFCFSVVDAGMLRLLPPLLRFLEEHAPGIGLRIVPLDVERLEASLESGHLDFVMGSFPSLSKRIRRQLLWSVTYVSVARADHPRLGARPSFKAFAAERHVLVSAVGTGHAHRLAERALEEAIDPSRIVCRVPTFVTAAFVASRTDAVVTVPATMAAELAEPLKLRTFAPPLKMPRIDVSQYWHERFHREPGSQWIRGLFVSLFAGPGAEPA
ncbi:MAG TPA: LysR family transcriptional regulator [Gammaproteobacteria bacterium]|nr:LysR family transcriptional regulator [Gammaproteobacteria bacterium]